MSLTTRVVLAILLPALCAGIGSLACMWAGKRGYRVRAALFQGSGLVIGLTAAQWAVSGWPPLLPADVTLAFPHLGLLAILAGTAQASGSRLAWPASALVGALGIWFLLGPKLRNSWGWGMGLIYLLLFAVVLLLIWHLLGRGFFGESNRGPAAPLLLVVLSGLSAGALVISHTAFLSQLAGALAAGLFVLALFSLWDRSAGLNPGGASAVIVTLCGIWICGYFYASLPPQSLALLGLSLVSLGMRLPATGPGSDWKSWLLRGTLVVLLAGLAFYRAYSLNAGDLGDYEDYYDS